MAGTSNYPTGYDTYAEVAATLDGTPTHEQDHENKGRAIEKIEAELGLSPSGSYATVAAAIAALLYDSGWQTLAAVAGFSGNVLYRRVGQMVTVNIPAVSKTGSNISGVDATSLSAVLPADCRPATTAPRALASVSNPAGVTNFQIESSGAIHFPSLTINVGGTIHGSIAFPVNI